MIFGRAARIAEAFNANKKAVDLVLEDAQAYSNLRIVLQKLGRSQASEISYRQAITLKPDYSEPQRMNSI